MDSNHTSNLGKIEEQNSFLVEKRYNDRMIILTPKRDDGNYDSPDYTFIFLNGLTEKATNYAHMYLNPE